MRTLAASDVMVGLLLAGVLTASSCGCDQKEPPAGAKVEASTLQPDASPGERAVMPLLDVSMPVDLEYSKKGDEISITTKLNGATHEREIYHFKDDEFAVKLAAETEFRPPMALLKFPFVPGAEALPWTGTVFEAGRERKANATASSTRVQLAGAEAIKVTVSLKIEVGQPAPAVRELSFWFAPGKGVIQREFGAGLTRRPPEAQEEAGSADGGG